MRKTIRDGRIVRCVPATTGTARTRSASQAVAHSLAHSRCRSHNHSLAALSHDAAQPYLVAPMKKVRADTVSVQDKGWGEGCCGGLLGHCWARAIQLDAPVVLPSGTRLPPRA
jgi:hypothetical protein